MKKIINRLRNQPEEDRRHILHILTFAFAIILIIIWIYSLGKTITSTDTKIKIKQDLKPFTMLKDSLVNTDI
ncbi:MAG: hypothetical protein AAB493_00230 [Patescibacteria group bacterium]